MICQEKVTSVATLALYLTRLAFGEACGDGGEGACVRHTLLIELQVYL